MSFRKRIDDFPEDNIKWKESTFLEESNYAYNFKDYIVYKSYYVGEITIKYIKMALDRCYIKKLRSEGYLLP